MDSVTARWADAFQVITDDNGWQHFRWLDPALVVSPAPDCLEDRATMAPASWALSAGTVSTGRLVLDAEGTPGSSPFDVHSLRRLTYVVYALYASCCVLRNTQSAGLGLGTAAPP
jgi:hypothetical protein